MDIKVLETSRLILREFQETDLADFHEYAKSPNVGPSAGWPPHRTKEDSLNILQQFMDSDEVWAIEYKDHHKVVGSIGFHKCPLRNTDQVKMIGYVLSEEYWGYGLVTEAARRAISYGFEELNLNLITVHHYPFNNRSKRVIEKCGFQYEGTLRHASKTYDGSVFDIVCYSITKEEWNKLH